MTPDQFVAKWKLVDLPERAASQEHFLDLCHLLGQPTPAAEDPTGESYCFEKSVKVVGAASKGSKGDSGFVDVWKKGAFGWEYKRKNLEWRLEQLRLERFNMHHFTSFYASHHIGDSCRVSFPEETERTRFDILKIVIDRNPSPTIIFGRLAGGTTSAEYIDYEITWIAEKADEEIRK